MSEPLHHPSSYRDPSGFVFQVKGVYYRQVNQCYADDYERLMSSNLYAALVENKWMISHEEVAATEDIPATAHRYKTLKPEQLSFVSWPSEWCPGQLRDAGLLTLAINRLAIGKGMILKDATPFNIQFVHGRPLLIDTLSLERYDPAKPWIAYRQFCENFLFPLFSQRYLRTDISKLISAYPEGMPAGLTARILPLKSRWNAGAWMHLFLQSRIRKDNLVGKGSNRTATAFSKTKLDRLLMHLESILKGITTSMPGEKGWSNYYQETILSAAYLEEKEKIFRAMTGALPFATALDLGANDGHFTRLLARSGNSNVRTVAVDADWVCIETLYQWQKQEPSASDVLPLCIDLCNPTPDSGFLGEERPGFLRRMRADLVTALALVHHLALGRNVPLPDIARLFSRLTLHWLIVEFVPLSDEKAQHLVKSKDRHHEGYGPDEFEASLQPYFEIQRKEVIKGTERILYSMKKRSQ